MGWDGCRSKKCVLSESSDASSGGLGPFLHNVGELWTNARIPVLVQMLDSTFTMTTKIMRDEVTASRMRVTILWIYESTMFLIMFELL